MFNNKNHFLTKFICLYIHSHILHTTFFFNLISSSHHFLQNSLLSLNHSFYYMISLYTLGSFPPFSLNHTPNTCHCPFHLLRYMLDISDIQSILLSFLQETLHVLSVLFFFQFPTLILQAPLTTSLLLAHVPTNLTLNSTTLWSVRPQPIPPTAFTCI